MQKTSLTAHLLFLIGFVAYGTVAWGSQTSTEKARELISTTQNLITTYTYPQEAVAAVPEGPRFVGQNITVGIQVGHWKANEVPLELISLKRNTGSQDGNYTELESNYRIATETAKILEREGITVELLPTTVPQAYTADAFISVHADGSPRKTASGYKMAAPQNDRTGKAQKLSNLIQDEYSNQLPLPHDAKNVTGNMKHYYAFGHDRFDHSISEATPAAIVETGFITNPTDREYIYHNPEVPARAIAAGVIKFLEEEKK